MQQTESLPELNRVLREVDRLVDKYPRLIHTWRFLVSALWALSQYYATDAKNPPQSFSEQEYIPDTKKNINALLEGKGFSPDWERGFWFNAAVMRIDALWERLFKLFLPSSDYYDGPKLYSHVKKLRATPSNVNYNDSSFGKIRQIVNQLKHEPGGAHPNIREDRELPMQAIQDFLDILADSGLQKIFAATNKGTVLTGPRSRRKREYLA